MGMKIERADGRKANQIRPLSCSRGVLNRAHGSASWSQGETKVLAAVYGPKAGTKKNENPEKACIEVIWKPKTGQIGKQEKENEMIVRRTLQSICLLTVHPNTTTSVIIQVVDDDGSDLYEYNLSRASFIFLNLEEVNLKTFLNRDIVKLLPCAINAACAALVDAGIPLKHLAVAICCCLGESKYVLLDPDKSEEQKMKASVHLVFPNTTRSIIHKEEEESKAGDELLECGIITSVARGTLEVEDYLRCVKRGRAAGAKLSEYLRRSFQPN